MTSLLDIDVTDAPEPKVVPANEEYKLRIIDVTTDRDKNDEPYLFPRFEVVDEPLAKDFTKFLRLPHGELSEKELIRVRSDLRKFLEAFELPNPFKGDPTDMKGKTGWAILGVGEDEQYGEQNYIKKFIAPK